MTRPTRFFEIDDRLGFVATYDKIPAGFSLGKVMMSTRRTATVVAGLILFVMSGCVEKAPVVDSSDGGGISDSGTNSDGGGELDSGLDAGTLSDTGTRDSGADAGEDAGTDMGTTSRQPWRTTDGLVLYYPFRDDTQITDEAGSRSAGFPQFVTVENRRLVVPYNYSFVVPRSGTLSETLASSNAFTIEIWLEVSGVPDNAKAITWGNFEIGLAGNFNSQYSAICLTQCETDAIQTDSVVVNGRMNHIVVTYDDGVMRLYSDGAHVGAWTGINGPADLLGVNDLGVSNGLLDAEFGLIAIYDRALSPGEIINHKNLGWDPTVDDEVAQPDLDSVALDTQGFRDQIGVREFSIGDGADTTPGLDVDASNRRHALLYIEHAFPEGSEVLATQLMVRSYLSDDAGTASVFALEKDWGAGVTWNQTGRAGQQWEAGGATGPSDRTVELASQVVDTSVGLDVLLDVTELSTAWQLGTDANYGFLFTCEGCKVFSESRDDHRSAFRSKLVSWLSLPRPNTSPERPAAPVVNGSSITNDVLNVTWDEPSSYVFHEIYVDGWLWTRSNKSFGEAALWTDSLTPTKVEVVAVDLWGRRSDFVDATP